MTPSVGRHRYVLAVAITVAVSLSGCTFAEKSSAPTAAGSSPTAAATPTPTPTVPPVELTIGTIVATGSLIGDDLISGDVDVRVTGEGTFDLRLLDFRSERNGDVELRVSPNVVEPGSECTTSIMNISYGNLPTGPHQVFPLMADFSHGDPSFLDTVIISHQNPVASQDGCHVTVLSSAVLTWTLPDLRPGLVVTDTGTTGGATGVATTHDGAPVAYTVAHGDLVPEVAARFGMEVEDIFYLNPTRTTIIAHPLLEVGEELNLSKAHR